MITLKTRLSPRLYPTGESRDVTHASWKANETGLMRAAEVLPAHIEKMQELFGPLAGESWLEINGVRAPDAVHEIWPGHHLDARTRAKAVLKSLRAAAQA